MCTRSFLQRLRPPTTTAVGDCSSPALGSPDLPSLLTAAGHPPYTKGHNREKKTIACPAGQRWR